MIWMARGGKGKNVPSLNKSSSTKRTHSYCLWGEEESSQGETRGLGTIHDERRGDVVWVLWEESEFGKSQQQSRRTHGRFFYGKNRKLPGYRSAKHESGEDNLLSNWNRGEKIPSERSETWNCSTYERSTDPVLGPSVCKVRKKGPKCLRNTSSRWRDRSRSRLLRASNC